MPTPTAIEVSREILDGKIHVKYSDNTVKILDMPDAPPENLVVDADESPKGGHRFTQKELKDRGHND